jgi:transcription elongation factor Elf1
MSRPLRRTIQCPYCSSYTYVITYTTVPGSLISTGLCSTCGIEGQSQSGHSKESHKQEKHPEQKPRAA